MSRKLSIKVGETFGSLTVIGEAYIKGKKGYYSKVRCTCLKEFDAHHTRLRTGKAFCCINCSMKRREENRLNGTSQLEQAYNHNIRLRSKKNNISYDLTIKEFSEITSKNCYYCNVKPKIYSLSKRRKYRNNEPLSVNGIDRVDNTKGYTKSNCVPCCESCNKMKTDSTLEEFLNKIKIIYKHLNL